MKLVIGDPANIDNMMVELANHRFPNLGVLSIFAYLRQNSDGLQMHYIRGDLDLNTYLTRLETIRPDVFGISFASPVSDLAYKTINAVKEKFPATPVICGGTHPTAMPEEVLNHSKADICVIGEGEVTMTELMQHFLSETGNLAQIHGIAFRENGSIKKTQPCQHLKNLDALPIPAWDMVNLNEYEGLAYCKAKPNTAMVFSRGCAFNCVYCSNPVWRSSKPWLRLRPPEEIRKEIIMLYEKGIREIWIRADEFNSNLKWTLEVCRTIRDLNYKDLYFECNLRADKVTEELVNALRDINVWMINLGIETLNQRVLDGIRKKVTVHQIIDACTLLKRYGIDVYAWLMYYQIWEESGKLCYETPDEVNNTLRTVRQMHKKKLIDLMSWQVATPIPGAEMFNVAKRYNLISEPYQYNVWKISTAIPGISEKQIQIHRLKGMLLQAYIAYRKGRVSWSSRRNILNRVKYMINAAFKILKSNFMQRD